MRVQCAKMLQSCLGLLAFTALSAVTLPLCAQTRYTITDTGASTPFGDPYTDGYYLPTHINNVGLVAGASIFPAGTDAFVWSPVSGLQDLGRFPHGSYSAATALNDWGVVVGYGDTGAVDASGYPVLHSFIHVPLFFVTGLWDIGGLSGGTTLAYGINNEGDVIGTSQTGQIDPIYGAVQHAFRWTLWHGMQDLGTLPGGEISGAFDINVYGDVVGYSTDANRGVHAVKWDHKGTIHDLGALPVNYYSSAFGISDSGLITGGGSFPNEPIDTAGSGDAFLVDRQGNLLDLGLLPLGSSFSQGSSVNDAGQVVGIADDTDYNAHGFVWNQADGILDLNCLVPPVPRYPFRKRKTLTWGTRINSHGVIVAHEVTGNTFPAAIVVLTPNPAPHELAHDVTAQVSIVQGDLQEDPDSFQLYRIPAYLQTVTITNTSSQPIRGPISLVLDNELFDDLLNLSGYTNYVAPLCSPYINVPLGTANRLLPGQSASVTLTVASEYVGINFSYTPRILAGDGGR